MAEEKIFENKVKAFLKSENCWVLKTWSNGIQRAGIPDLLISCFGAFVGVELKARNGKPSELQLYNLRKIEESGGYAILLYPDDFITFQSFIRGLRCREKAGANVIYQNLRRRWCNEIVRN